MKKLLAVIAFAFIASKLVAMPTDFGGGGSGGSATFADVTVTTLTVQNSAYLNTVSGGVGIGTSNPGTNVVISSKTLYMDGTSPTLVVGGASAINAGIIEARIASGLSGVTSLSGTRFSRIFATDSGNPGLTWLAGLSLRIGPGSLNGGSFTEELTFDDTASNGIMNMGLNDTGPDAQLEVKSAQAAAGYIVAVSSQNDTTGNILAVMGDGKIGINDTAPAYRLDVLDATAGPIIQWGDGTRYGELYTDSSSLGVGSRTNHQFYFLQNDTVRMTIDTDGDVGIGNTAPASRFVVDFPAAQTIAAGNTVAADACGSLKLITAGGAVTTDTTNTFTAPAAGNKGCIMHVCNTGSNNITLDANANFKSFGGLDVIVTADDCVTVGSTGASGFWSQLTTLVAN